MMRVLSLILSLCLFSPSVSHAALQVYAGTFTLTTGITTQTVSGIVDKDGNAFTPEVVIAWLDKNTAEATFSAHAAGSFGVAVDRDTDQQGFIAFYNTDNVAANDSLRCKRTDAFIAVIINASACSYNLVASISSFGSGQFVINKTTNNDGSLPIVKYLALGGSDLEDAYLTEIIAPTETGSEVYTGFPWQGNLLMLFGLNFTSTGNQTGADMIPFFGFARSSSERAAMATFNDDPSASGNAQSYISASKCLSIFDMSTQNIEVAADFTGWTSDGFELNYSSVFSFEKAIFALALKGTFQSSINVQARPTSTTTQDITTGFPSVGGMIFGSFPKDPDLDTEVNDNHISIGAFDQTRNHGKWWGNTWTGTATDVNMYSSATAVYTQATNPSTVAAQAAVSAILSNGHRLNFTTADGNARYYISLGLGSAAGRRAVSPKWLQ